MTGQTIAVRFIDGAWIVWLLIWIFLSGQVKRVVRREHPLSRLAHLIPMTAAGLLLVSGAPFHGTWLGAAMLPRAPWMAYAGALLTGAGLLFAVQARLVLAGNWSGTVTLKHGHELIRHGPYAIVRHPIYTGLLTAMLGTAIAIDQWRGVLAVAILLGAFLAKLRTEEGFMREAFGDAYREYCKAVPALIPVRKKALLFEKRSKSF